MLVRWIASWAALASAGLGLATPPISVLPQTASVFSNTVLSNATFVNYDTTSAGLCPRYSFASNGAWAAIPYSTAQDYSAYDGVIVKIRNEGSTPATLLFRMDNQPSSFSSNNYLLSRLTILPGREQAVAFYYNPSAGPNGQPMCLPNSSDPAILTTAYQTAFDPSKVFRWQLYNLTNGPATVSLREVELVDKRTDFSSMVDAYGQFVPATWSTKVSSNQDLANQLSSELSQLSGLTKVTAPDSWVKKALPSVTGAWSTQKTSAGNWFFTKPDGTKFWTIGVNAVNYDNASRLGGRESAFVQLPVDNASWGSVYNSRVNLAGQTVTTVNMAMANLQKKYDADWKNQFATMALDRLPKWGFNTLGAWADSSVIKQGMPYTLLVDTLGFGTKLTTPFAIWGKIPDPYAPGFRDYVRTKVANAVAASGSSDLMGIFVDNEISWGQRYDATNTYQVALSALDAPGNQPARQALLSLVKAKYGTIGRLNRAWQTKFANFNYMKSLNRTSANLPAVQSTDLKAFQRAFAAQYYKTVRLGLKDAAPGVLYLGSRNVPQWTPQEVMDASQDYVDVNSFNLYFETNNDWQVVAALKKPFMISEFNYSAVDRGYSTYGLPTEAMNQADRATFIQAYLTRALNTPNCVGVHFFDYMDNCPAGRYYDDERWNCGLLDETDYPYNEVTMTFRSFAQTVGSVRN